MTGGRRRIRGVVGGGLASALITTGFIAIAPNALADVPVRCSPVLPIASGANHTLTLDGSGNVWGSGSNGIGQLGRARSEGERFLTPVAMPSVERAVAVAAGDSFSLALDRDGHVWAWGWNDRGQLADGSATDRSAPQKIAGLDDVVAIAAGSFQAFAIRTDGTLWGWGWNDAGQLGDGTTITRRVPVQVALTNVTRVASGWRHSVAVTSDGSVWAWGHNIHGQLGLGSPADFVSTPSKIPGLDSMTEVAAGRWHSLALRSNGAIWAWGSNDEGELGLGSTGGPDRFSPVQSVATDATQIAAGLDHSLALRADGTLRSWGSNSWGQLGVGSLGGFTGVPQVVSGLTDVRAVSAGGHNTSAVTGGAVKVWGYNTDGEVGDGSQLHRAAATTMLNVTQALPSTPVDVLAYPGEHLAYLEFEQTEAVVTRYVITPYRYGVPLAHVMTESWDARAAVRDLVAGDVYSFTIAAQNCLGTGTPTTQTPRVIPTEVDLGTDSFVFERQPLGDRMSLNINAFNGNLNLTARDVSIRGRGVDLVIERTYNSRAEVGSVFGNGWSTNLGVDVRLIPRPDGSIYLRGPGGATTGFPLQADGTGYDTPAGLRVDLVHNADGTYTLQQHQSLSKLEFDSGGTLRESTDRNGNAIAYQYASGRVAAVEDTAGRAVTITYNGAGFVESLTDAMGRQWGYEYDGSGNLVRFRDPAGGITDYAYTDARLSSVTAPADGTSENPTATFSYSASRLSSWSVPELDVSWTFTYELDQTVVTDGNGHPTTYEFDPIGRPRRVIDALGNEAAVTYTSTSNIGRHTGAGGGVTSFAYASNGLDLTATEAPTGYRTELEYGDSRHPHLPTAAIDAQGNHLRFAYDDRGNLVGETTDFDEALGNRVEVDHDQEHGLVVESRDPRGNATRYEYDAETGDVLKVTPPPPLGEVEVEYDAISRPVAVTDGNGHMTHYEYDPLDRLTQTTFHDGSAIQVAYDPNGNVVARDDHTGTSTFEYDALNRLVEERSPDAGTTRYEYDNAGNLTAVEDAGGRTTYRYSDVNLLVAITDPGDQTIAMTYDAESNRTSLQYPNGVVTTSAYDESARLTTTTTLDSNEEVLAHFEYDYALPADGSDTALRQRVTNAEGEVTRYEYDALNQLSSATSTDATGALLRSFGYTYDGVGNRLSQRRVEVVGGEPLTTVIAYTYNAANQLTRVKLLGGDNPEGVTLQYDGAGNLTGNSAGALYAYSAAGQTILIQPTTASLDPNASVGVPLQFAYQGTGQSARLSAGPVTTVAPSTLCAVGCPTGPTVSTTEFTHTMLGVSGESAAGPAPSQITTTLFTVDLTGAALASRTARDTSYYVFDGLGSVVGVTDSTGRLLTSYEYDPFGNPLEVSDQSVLSPWRFAGGYLDQTGLYKFGERYYDPTLGRWTQQDPIYNPLDPKQWNRYVYVGNDPVNFVDPTGLSPWDWATDAWNCLTSSLEAGLAAGAVVFLGGEVLEAWSAGLAAAIATGTVAAVAYVALGAVIVAAVVVAVAVVVKDRC